MSAQLLLLAVAVVVVGGEGLSSFIVHLPFHHPFRMISSMNTLVRLSPVLSIHINMQVMFTVKPRVLRLHLLFQTQFDFSLS